MELTSEEKYAVNFASWILDNGFQPSDTHPHKWMNFNTVGVKPKHYTEIQIHKQYKAVLEKERKAKKPCKHDYQPDSCMGVEIHVCTKCDDVI